MKKIIPLRDLMSLTYRAYKKHLKKMTKVLNVLFLVTMVPIAAEVFFKSDSGFVEGFFQKITEANLSLSSIVAVGLVAFILYMVLLLVNILLSIGFVQKVSNIENSSFEVKGVWEAGKALIKPTIWLSLKMFLVSLSVLAIIGIPAAAIVGASMYFLPPALAALIAGVVLFVAFALFAFVGVHIAFAQLALYVDGKKDLQAIEHSVEIVQGNIWNIVWRVSVYYVILFALLVPGALIFDLLQNIILQSVYGVKGVEALSQLEELRVTGVLVGEITLAVIINMVNTFVVVPVTVIASIILYRSLQDSKSENSNVQDGKRDSKDLPQKCERKQYVSRLYKAGWWVLGIAVISPVIIMTIVAFFA